MKRHMLQNIQRNDESIELIMAGQCLDKDSIYYGGWIDPDCGYCEPCRGTGLGSNLMLHYCCPYSKLYNNDDLLYRAYIGFKFSFRFLHADNTYDLMCTNYHDPTSVAFNVRLVAPALKALKRHMENSASVKEMEIDIYNIMIEFLTKSTDSIVGRGFHTPNHRWVNASALAYDMNILGMPELQDEIDKYLAEGIDCDESGEYAERSISIYNLTNNESCIILALELKRPEFLEYVNRNLYMTLNYLEPDGSIFTLNSTRQDFGVKTYPFLLYEEFMIMAHLTHNTDFAYAADCFFNMSNRSKYDLNNQGYYTIGVPLFKYMEHDFLRLEDMETTPFDMTKYNSFQPGSNIARVRNGETSMTVLAQQPIFFKYEYRFLAIHAKFMGRSYLVPEIIGKTEKGYTLFGTDGYVTADMEFTFREEDNEVDIEIETKCPSPYPCSLLLLFDHEGLMESDDFNFRTKLKENILVKKGSFEYSHFMALALFYTIKIESDFNETAPYQQCLLNVLPSDKNAFTVLLSGVAPYKKKVTIKVI